MKKVFAVLMCVVILCMTMCITAFAAESGAIVIEKDVVDGQQLENGHTYVFEYYPWVSMEGSAKSPVSVVKDSNIEVVYLNRYMTSAVSTLYAVQASNSTMSAGNTVICVNKNYKDAWTSDCFKFNVSSTSEIKDGKLLIVSMTVPDDGCVYTLSLNYPAADIADLRVYESVVHSEHVYDNTCDAICNECNRERTITHTYSDENDHTCIVCGFDNPNPTHVYDNDKDLTCNYCDYERPKLSVWDNLKGLSAFLFGMVGLAASLVMENSYLQVACIGIPVILLSLAFFSDLLRKRV